MAKHRHLTKAAGKSNRGKQLGPHRRTDISKLTKRERDSLITYAACIQALVDAEQKQGSALLDEALEQAAVQFHQTLVEVREAMAQYQRYHAAHKGEHPANAFTPIPREFQRRKAKRASFDKQQPANRSAESKPPRPGIELSLIIDEGERNRIKDFAEVIFNLRQLQDTLGQLPPGMLAEVADAHGYAEVWISKSIANQRIYCEFFPDHDYMRAHTPKPVGRPKGRQSSPEVIDAIEKARVNRKWLSRDGAGNYSEIDNIIEKRLIHSLVEQTYGSVHSQRTTYRIIKDYEERHAARVAVADEGDASVLQEHLPAIANRASVRGPGDRCQFDIRPLPVVVDNDGVESTVHAMLVVDDATERITSWELVFVKFIDDQGEEQTQNFDGQLCRATVARSCLEIGGRYRTYYADNGFKEIKHHQHFMIAPGEDPTRIVYRRRYRARGGGGIEVSQQIMDGFLKTQPYYVRERDFRRSRKKSRKNLTAAAALRTDFAQYVWHWNNDDDPKGGPSRIARWNEGPNLMLTAPSPTNLAMFALSQWRDTREPRQDPDCWFPLGGVSYVGARPDPSLYERFADLSIRRSKLEAKKKKEADIKLCVFELGGTPPQRLVLFSLDNEATWELAVPAESRSLSWQRHNKMLMDVEHRLEHGDGAELGDFFMRTILRSANAPLVIDGLRRNRQFYPHESAESQDRIDAGSTGGELDIPTAAADSADIAPPSPNADVSQPGQNQPEIVQQVATGTTALTVDSADMAPPSPNADVSQPGQDQPDVVQQITTGTISPEIEPLLAEAASLGQQEPSTAEVSSGKKRRRGNAASQPAPVTPPEAEDDIDIPNFIAEMQRKAKP
ncbi:hypothetical protein K2Z83_10945 [Oscillochloris sp. ZM17-4]|uniref:hypothetical protein n=1 Tax=Oscillochloris sp. ZM17-4 TaxID=2866714 RepID=UPI001C739091|nr:hypothetical protein [Oscillochloris sp. ZM17-4]MBX0328194.1 hypothetical protein [Oscillochloris sp. ZM17-4]